MVTINVVKAFVLTLSEDVKKEFHVGRHTVEDDIAGHWYVKAHIGDEEAVAADAETEAQAQALAEAIARAEAAEQALAALQAGATVTADVKSAGKAKK